MLWSPQPGLNWRPRSYQERALPLSYVGPRRFPVSNDKCNWCRGQDSNLRSLTAADLQSAGINHSPTPAQTAILTHGRVLPKPSSYGFRQSLSRISCGPTFKRAPGGIRTHRPADYKSAALPLRHWGTRGLPPRYAVGAPSHERRPLRQIDISHIMEQASRTMAVLHEHRSVIRLTVLRLHWTWRSGQHLRSLNLHPPHHLAQRQAGRRGNLAARIVFGRHFQDDAAQALHLYGCCTQ